MAGFGVLFLGIDLLKDAFSGLAAGISLPHRDGPLGVALIWPLVGHLTAFLEARFRSAEEDEARPRRAADRQAPSPPTTPPPPWKRRSATARAEAGAAAAKVSPRRTACGAGE